MDSSVDKINLKQLKNIAFNNKNINKIIDSLSSNNIFRI